MKMRLKIVIFTLTLFSAIAAIQAQDVQIGQELTIETPSDHEYRFIYFPRKNFIIKQGGIADLKMVRNLKVIVTDLEYREGTKTLVTLKRKDGGRFFNALFSVKADLDRALNAGELKS